MRRWQKELQHHKIRIRLTESMKGAEGKDSSETLHSTSVCMVLMSDCSPVRGTLQVEAEGGRNSNAAAKYWLLWQITGFSFQVAGQKAIYPMLLYIPPGQSPGGSKGYVLVTTWDSPSSLLYTSFSHKLNNLLPKSEVFCFLLLFFPMTPDISQT